MSSAIPNQISIAIVDDHRLLLNGLEELINGLNNCQVIFTAMDKAAAVDAITNKVLVPDILLLDIKLKRENGLKLIPELKAINSDIKIVMLTMSNNEENVIEALRLGAVGYLLKDIDAEELHAAIMRIHTDGFYYTKEVNEVILNAVKGEYKSNLNPQEREFLKHTCSELTYKEIASEMFVSPRTIDGYRESLFSKLQIKSRTGLVLYAIKSGIYEISH